MNLGDRYPSAWPLLWDTGKGPEPVKDPEGTGPSCLLSLGWGQSRVHLEGRLYAPAWATHCSLGARPGTQAGASSLPAHPGPGSPPRAGVIVGNASHMPLLHLHLIQYNELPGPLMSQDPWPLVLCGQRNRKPPGFWGRALAPPPLSRACQGPRTCPLRGRPSGTRCMGSPRANRPGRSPGCLSLHLSWQWASEDLLQEAETPQGPDGGSSQVRGSLSSHP